MQVCHCLAHGKSHLVQVQGACEQHRHDIARALRPGFAGLHHFGQALAVVGVQLFNAHMQTGERLAVRR